MLIEYIKAIIFGIVEGITEWLPVSSTGHLILLEEFLPLNVAPSLGREFAEEYFSMFEVVIQLGAILAVVVMFFSKLNPFALSKSRSEKKITWVLWGKVLVASIPAALIGIVVDELIEAQTGKDIDGWIYNWGTVATTLILYGVLFIIIERIYRNKESRVVDVNDVSFSQAAAIGCFQVLSIIPGTSRSGSTILGARAIVPVGAWLVLLIASVSAFLVSTVAIKFLMEFVKRHSFAPFGVYRIALGVLVILYFAIVR